MVELEQRPIELMTFTNGKKTAEVPYKDTYRSYDVTNALTRLGITIDSSRIYDVIHQFAPNSQTSTPYGNRFHRLNPKEYSTIVNYYIQKHESRNTNTLRPYIIDPDNETVIELQGISDYKWKVYEPLLNLLRTTRSQNELGEILITPIAYQEVKSFLPKNGPKQSIYTTLRDLNKALAPSGWSVIREGKKTTKPIDAPWYIKGPNVKTQENLKNTTKGHKRENIFDRTASEEKKRIAIKQFDPLAFKTSLLHICLSNLTNPEAKKIFTKNRVDLMTKLLPGELKLQDVIGSKTSEEFFQDSIIDAVHSISGKKYEQLSVIQKANVDLLFLLKFDSANDPDMVIFQHFESQPNPDKSLSEATSNNDVIQANKKTRPKTPNKDVVPRILEEEKPIMLPDDDETIIYGLNLSEGKILKLVINGSKEDLISARDVVAKYNNNYPDAPLTLGYLAKAVPKINNMLAEQSLYTVETCSSKDTDEDRAYRFTKRTQQEKESPSVDKETVLGFGIKILDAVMRNQVNELPKSLRTIIYESSPSKTNLSSIFGKSSGVVFDEEVEGFAFAAINQALSYWDIKELKDETTNQDKALFAICENLKSRYTKDQVKQQIFTSHPLRRLNAQKI